MSRFSSILPAALLAVVACTDPRPSSAARATATTASVTPVVSDAGSVGTAPDAADDVAAPSPPRDLRVPRARGLIHPTGHFRIELWDGAPSTGVLRDREGKGAVPISEGRFLWGNGALALFFYAGDLDLEARVDRHDGPVWNDDSVELAFAGPADAGGESRRVIRVSVKGVVSDGLCPGDASDLSDPRCDLRWESGARAATDFDGTLNSIADRDEEWALEATIPLASLDAPKVPGTRIPIRMSRCEIAHDGPRACGAWDGVLVLGDEAAVPSGTDRVRERARPAPP